MFNLYTENTLKESRIGGRLNRGLLTYKSRSSAYNETQCSSSCLLIHLNPLSDFSAMNSGSSASNSGEGGHPSSVPRKRGKGSERCVFVYTSVWGEEYNNLIQEIKWVCSGGRGVEERSQQVRKSLIKLNRVPVRWIATIHWAYCSFYLGSVKGASSISLSLAETLGKSSFWKKLSIWVSSSFVQLMVKWIKWGINFDWVGHYRAWFICNLDSF